MRRARSQVMFEAAPPRRPRGSFPSLEAASSRLLGSAPPSCRRRFGHAGRGRRRSRRDPQDPPRRDHHAGEPLVRLLLRHVPGRRRDPGTRGQSRHGRRAIPIPGRTSASSRTTTPPIATRAARTTPSTRSRTSTAARWTGSSGRHARERFLACHNTDNPGCSLTPTTPDVMGYHDWHEIPNYWDYARNFVLQDHMFEADNSWSLPAHLSWSPAGRRAARSTATR